jgi:CheY-like chemotaxis protein
VSLRGTKMLLVEDEADSAEPAKLLLEFRGALVTVAGNGIEALRSIVQDCPGLIVSDLMMPGLDGFGLARAVRRMPECAHVRLVALSGLPVEETYVRTWSVGFDAQLEKPLTFEKLAERLLFGNPPGQANGDKLRHYPS